MHKYTYNGKKPNYLILHKTEWNRLQRQSGPPEEPSVEQQEYIQSLIEKSHEWTKTWPDHKHGFVMIYKQELKKKREEQIATVKAFRKLMKPQHSEEAIRLAKQKIFNQSCYGVKLLSAFRESKTIEERDMQLKFKKEMKEKQELESEESKIEPYCYFGLDRYKNDEDECRKYAAQQTVLQNKEIYEKQKAEIAKTIEAQKQGDIEDLQLMTKLLKVEEDVKTNNKYLKKESREQNIAENKIFKAERAMQAADYNAKIEKCYKEKDKLQQKINSMHRKVCKNSNLPWTKKIFDTVALCQEEEKKRYNAFLENNTKLGEHRSAKREQRLKEKERKDLEKAILIAETNKKLAEFERQSRCSEHKCLCDRQSLLVKSHKVKKENVDDKGIHQIQRTEEPRRPKLQMKHYLPYLEIK